MELVTLADYGLIALAIVALAILAVIGVLAIKLIQIFLGKLGIKLTSDQLLGLEDVVTKVVKTLNQTIVEKLKKLNPNSKLTDEQKKEIYDQAFELIKKAATDGQLEALTKQYGDIETGLKFLIEASVVDNKQIVVAELDSTIDCADGQIKMNID